MKVKLLNAEGNRTFAVVFENGDEVTAGLREFAAQNKVTAASFTAIGALEDVVLGWFNLEDGDYERIPVEEQVEVLTLVGNIAIFEGKPKVHAHVVVGKRDGTAHGGHLMEAHVRPTLEVVVVETPVHLVRKTDEHTGLALIDLEAATLPPRRGRTVADEVLEESPK